MSVRLAPSAFSWALVGRAQTTAAVSARAHTSTLDVKHLDWNIAHSNLHFGSFDAWHTPTPAIAEHRVCGHGRGVKKHSAANEQNKYALTTSRSRAKNLWMFRSIKGHRQRIFKTIWKS
jgi:hypothetical protein